MKFKVTLLILVIIMAQVGFSNAENAHTFLKRAHATDTVDPQVAERMCHQLLEDGDDQVSDELALTDFWKICKAAAEKKVTFSQMLDQWLRMNSDDEEDDNDDNDDDDEQASIENESTEGQPVQYTYCPDRGSKIIYCGVRGSKVYITQGDTYNLEIKGDPEDIKTIETGSEGDNFFIRNKNSVNPDNKQCKQGIVCINDVCSCAGQKSEPAEEMCCPNGIRCIDDACVCTEDGSIVRKWLKSNNVIIQSAHGGKFCTFGDGIVQNTQREKNVEIYLTLPDLEKLELEGVCEFIISDLQGSGLSMMRGNQE